MRASNALVCLVTVTVAAAKCSNSLKPSYDAPVAAKGWGYHVVAQDLGRPRGLIFDSEQALLVVNSGKGIERLVLKDDGGSCVSVANKTTVVEDSSLDHGIEISGSWLYASTANDVWAWPYDAKTGQVDQGSRRTLITNMTNEGHTSRTLLFSKANPNWLIVSRGSQGNDDRLAEIQSTGHSQIRAFDVSAQRDTPYNYPTDGEMLGWGLRNSVGIDEHPITKGIFSVENSVDNLKRNGIDIHVDNPGEELNYHGTLEKIEGGNYGYPLCYTLWSTDAPFPNLGNLSTGDNFAPDRTANAPTTNDTTCNSQYISPQLAFQAHTAPLDIKFDTKGENAYVSFHGSWNRPDPVGYSVAQIAWDSSSGRPTPAKNSKDAAVPILSNKDLSKCPKGCFRPVGLAWGTETTDRLFFTSDSTGEVYVLAKGDSSAASRMGVPCASVLVAAAILLGWVL